jgi:hypothetical protein
MKTLTTLTLALTLAACGVDPITTKLDPRDLTNPVVITGGSPDVRAAAASAIAAMGGSIGEADDPHVELVVADDPSCRHCLDGLACGAARTLWTCPRINDMSRNQAGRNVWSGVAQALWGVETIDAPCDGRVLRGPGCGTSDDPPAWTAADLAAICARVRGGRCR